MNTALGLLEQISKVKNDAGIKMDKSNTIGLIAHHHTANYAETKHHHVHGSGFKMEKDGQTYVVTTAHNLYEIQQRPFQYGVTLATDLPHEQAGQSPSEAGVSPVGDGDIVEIGGRLIACLPSSTSATFWDVTKCHTAPATLIASIPRQNNEVTLNNGNNVWIQIKVNRSSLFAYQQPGELLLGGATSAATLESELTGTTDIYDLSNAHNNDIKLVSKFKDPITAANPNHVRIVRGVWDVYVSSATDENNVPLFENFEAFFQDAEGKSLIHANHNLQISNKHNLLGLCGCQNMNAFKGVTGPLAYGGVMVYDINPATPNPIDDTKSCAEMPWFLGNFCESVSLKRFTPGEIALIEDNAYTDFSALFDDNGQMKLEKPLMDPTRETVNTTSIATYPGWTSGQGYWFVHDFWLQDDIAYITKGSIGDGFALGSFGYAPEKNYFGYTLGNFVAVNISGFREYVHSLNLNNPTQLQVYQFPLNNECTGKYPESAFPHNITPNTDGTVVYCGYELPNFTSQNDHVKRSKIHVYDLSDLSNIKYARVVDAPCNVNYVDYDTNHNFTVQKYEDGTETLAFADYTNGVSVYNITGSLALNPVCIGVFNSAERLYETNPWYSQDLVSPVYPWCNNYWQWTGNWGVTLSPKLVNNKPLLLSINSQNASSVYNVDNYKSTEDIRDFTHAASSQPFTVNPYMKEVDYVKCYDYDSKTTINLQVHAYDRYTDVAVLKAAEGYVLSGGVRLGQAEMGDACVAHMGNGAHGKTISKGFISSSYYSPSPTLIYKIGRNFVDVITSDGHSGMFEQVHEMPGDMGNAMPEKVNYSELCTIGVPCILASFSVPNGSSGSPVVDMNNNLIGMIQMRKTDGTDAQCVAIEGGVVMKLASQMIDGTYAVPYMGLQLKQDVINHEGYLITGFTGPAKVAIDAMTVTAAAWEVVAADGVNVGPEKKSITEMLLNKKVGETMKLALQPMSTSGSGMSTSYLKAGPTVEISVTLDSRPTVLMALDETTTGNINTAPIYPWFYESKMGFYI